MTAGINVPELLELLELEVAPELLLLLELLPKTPLPVVMPELPLLVPKMPPRATPELLLVLKIPPALRLVVTLTAPLDPGSGGNTPPLTVLDGAEGEERLTTLEGPDGALRLAGVCWAEVGKETAANVMAAMLPARSQVFRAVCKRCMSVV